MGMNGPWVGMYLLYGWALGMGQPPWALEIDGPSVWMGSGHGWAPVGNRDG